MYAVAAIFGVSMLVAAAMLDAKAIKIEGLISYWAIMAPIFPFVGWPLLLAQVVRPSQPVVWRDSSDGPRRSERRCSSSPSCHRPPGGASRPRSRSCLTLGRVLAAVPDRSSTLRAARGVGRRDS